MKNGGPMMETQDEFGEPAALVFYDLCSKDFNHTAIYAKGGSFFVDSYMETLLLLDHLDSSAFSITNWRQAGGCIEKSAANMPSVYEHAAKKDNT